MGSSRGGTIVKNTLVLYIRMLVLMFVNLYTSRVILGNLGVEDYGIYSVIGSIVASFSLISGSLSAAISRFITFELGSDDSEQLRKTFSAAVSIQIITCLIVIIIGELIGGWFINHKMEIPEERLGAAMWVFQFTIVTFCFKLISIPYDAAIVAHEKMSAFAFISVWDGLGKLFIASVIGRVGCDKLIIYAALMCLLALIVRLQYGWYCKRHFEECKFCFSFDKNLTKKMFAFAGWNYIGSGAGLLQGSGVSIMLSTFFFPSVNAARGLATHATNSMLNFITNFMTALNPQITKSYAAGEHEYMMKVIYAGIKLSFCLFAILSTPVLFNTEFLLNIWLENPPEYVVAFTQLSIIYSLLNVFSKPLITAMLATGNIRNYQIIVGGIKLLTLPVDYILLRIGCQPTSVYFVAIVIEMLCLSARIILLKGMINLNVKDFVFVIILRSSIYYCLIMLVNICISSCFVVNSIVMFVAYFVLCVVLSIIITWLMYCNSIEKQMILTKIASIKTKIKG